MHVLKLIFKNALRHRLRTALTVLGIVIAILSFGLLQTVVDAWYAGAAAASDARLVTRNAISLSFSLPLNYQSKIRAVDGVNGVSYASWFGGVYRDRKNFFPQFAIDAKTYLDLYPEYRLSDAERTAFLRDRRGAVVGRRLANQYGFKVGDPLPLRGAVYPGNWEFVVRGIYEGAQPGTDTTLMFVHWDYVNETLKRTSPRRVDQVGLYIVRIANPDDTAAASRAIDALFRNSIAETLTETERAFHLGFVSMTEAIVIAIRIVSFVVIGIILAVMANTMAMSARERYAEYATLKALGFGPGFLARLIVGESLAICVAGAAAGMLLTFPVAAAFAARMGTLFKVFNVSAETLVLQASAALAVGLAAAVVPAIRVARTSIVNGLRAVG